MKNFTIENVKSFKRFKIESCSNGDGQNSSFGASKWPQLISRKIWEVEKSWNSTLCILKFQIRLLRFVEIWTSHLQCPKSSRASNLHFCSSLYFLLMCLKHAFKMEIFMFLLPRWRKLDDESFSISWINYENYLFHLRKRNSQKQQQHCRCIQRNLPKLKEYF